MTFEALKQKHPDGAQAYPTEWERPTQQDLSFIVNTYGCQYPQSFVDFQLCYCHQVPMGDVAFDGFGWANRNLDPYLNLEELVRDYQANDFPDYLTPFRQDNGDFWCFDTRKPDLDGEFPIVIWDHNSNSVEKDSAYQWKNFLDWLDKTMEE